MTIGTVVADGKSLKGRNRKKNDDRFLVTDLGGNSLLLAVSDGMGGHPGGDTAAEEIIACLAAIDISVTDKSVLLTEAIKCAEIKIKNRVRKLSEFEGMGATATAVIISTGTVYWAHVGDSRLYLMRNGVLRQITRDHTFLRDLIDAGDVSVKAATSHPMRHVLDQCVGCMDAGIDSGRFEILENDVLLACSDGLSRAVSDEEIADLLLTKRQVPEYVDSLVEASLQAGNLDDITVVVALMNKMAP